MAGFESLGDSDVFGRVQRAVGVEPVGLSRFEGIFAAPWFRLDMLVGALGRRFEGLGEPGTVTVTAAGGPGRCELIVQESACGFRYRSGIREGELTVLVEREMMRLRSLRRGLLAELESGDKTFVWTSETTTREQLRPLLNALWRIGPNTLLWVVPADRDHPPGSVAMIERDFIRGYVKPFASVDFIDVPAWVEMCARCNELRQPMRAAAKREAAADLARRRLPHSLVLADIAEARINIERERIFDCDSIIALGDALAGHPNHIYFKAIVTTLTVRNYTLRDVVLDADTLLLLKDGEVIPETDYFATAFDPADRPEEALSEPSGDDEVLIFGYNNQHWGYQHWLTQCLPAIDWSLRQFRTETVRLLLPELQPWQEDLLALLGHAGVPRLRPRAGARYRLPRVEFSEFLNGGSGFGISLTLHDTIRRILDAVPAVPSSGKVLYISDTSPYHGRIGNEAAVIALLRQHGVTIVEPERLGTNERINLFRNADAVIGRLGPYLADVLFCRPGALLWEWMPRHHQNHTFCCLAQTAQLDYWGDLFEAAGAGEWDVDLNIVARRLNDLSVRLATDPQAVRTAVPERLALEKLMLRFESLGDNCEFGMVQREGGAEPLGLLRFNGIRVPEKERPGRLVVALERRFEGLGDPGTCVIVPEEVELFVSESRYDLWYHAGIKTGHEDLEAEARRQGTRLKFLCRKFFEDLENGDKILVWRSSATTRREQVQPLMDVLRRLGPNTLLWVTEADAGHPIASVEALEPDFLKGYVRRLGTDRQLVDIEFGPWFDLCRRVNELRPLGVATAAKDFLAPGGPAVPDVEPATNRKAALESWLSGLLRIR